MSEFGDLLDHLEGADDESFAECWSVSMSDERVAESFAQHTPEEQEEIRTYIHQWWVDHNKAQFAILIVDEATREVIEKYRSMFEDIPGWSE
jgi:hypothetical protein